MDDLISRQAAIDALHMHLMYRMGTDSNKKRLDDWINGVPSAQRKGKWIDIDSQQYTWKVRCNQCGAERSMMSTQGIYPNYCEQCGADMRGEQDG